MDSSDLCPLYVKIPYGKPFMRWWPALELSNFIFVKAFQCIFQSRKKCVKVDDS